MTFFAGTQPSGRVGGGGLLSTAAWGLGCAQHANLSSGLEKFSGTLLPSRATCFLIFLIFCCPVNVGGCPNCIDDVDESVNLVPA